MRQIPFPWASLACALLWSSNSFGMPTPTQGVRPVLVSQGSSSDALKKGAEAMAAKQPDQARRHFEAALRNDPKQVAAMLGLAELAFQSRNDGETLKWLQQAERSAPQRAEVQAALGRFYMARKQPEKGEPALRKAIALDPKPLRPRLDLADALMRRGADAEALPLLKAAVAQDPKLAGAQLALGQLQQRMGAAAEADKTLRAAAELEPKSALPWLMLARAQKSAAGALPLLEQALQRQSEHYDALMLRAYWQMESRDAAAARETLVRAAKADAKAAEPLVRLGLLEEQAGQRSEARRQYLVAIERDPYHPVALNNLVMMGLADKEDPARLELMAKRAVKALPGNAQVLDTLALVQRQRKDKTGALASAQAAVKLDPKDAGLMLTLAEMQLWNGDREAARRSAALVQQLKPAPALDARLRDLLSRI